MTTNAGIGHGSEFKRSSDGTSGGTFSSVGEITGITPPGLSRETVDATHMQSPDGFREFIGSLKDGGEVSIEVNFDPDHADVAAALADLTSSTPGYYKIVFPDTTEWGFAALMTGYETGDPLDDKMTATLTYKVTGKPTFVA